MNAVVHFEIPFDDKERAIEFYEKVFGWKLQAMPEMNYVMAYTDETDPNTFMLKKTNRINGGMYKRDKKSATSPVIVIDVQNIDTHIKKIKGAGGSIFREKVQVGNMGFYAQVKDPEGNIIGIWENIKKQ